MLTNVVPVGYAGPVRLVYDGVPSVVPSLEVALAVVAQAAAIDEESGFSVVLSVADGEAVTHLSAEDWCLGRRVDRAQVKFDFLSAARAYFLQVKVVV